jgi:cytochrome c peroxidase
VLPSRPIFSAEAEPITPIPQPPIANPLSLALGERLFGDRRLSHDGTLACSSCHNLQTNGADDSHRVTARDGSRLPFTVLTVFNAALSFRLNWEGNFRTLEAQAQSSLENPANMATSVDEVVGNLKADPAMVRQFGKAYGRAPDATSMLDAIAIYKRSLLTPGSWFDRWLEGDTTALTAEEQNGYRLFKSFSCISCHQGVGVGGNLSERHGIFHPLAAPQPEILRVPSLRNVAAMAPYFHDGSAPTLHDAVRQMALAQLDRLLSDDQIAAIVAFLNTLTGTFRGPPCSCGIAMKMSSAAFGVLLLIALLTWLSMQAINTDAERFDRALAELDRYSTAEAMLHSNVLSARAGLLRNYDPSPGRI